MGVESQPSVPVRLKHATNSRETERQGREPPILPLSYFAAGIQINRDIFYYTCIHLFTPVCISKMIKNLSAGDNLP